MDSSEVLLVRRFIDAWVNTDRATVMSLVADNISYRQMIEDRPIVSKEAFVRDQMSSYWDANPEEDPFEWEVFYIASDGPVVLVEGEQRFHTPDGFKPIHMVSVFKVANGQIADWYNYFDRMTVNKVHLGWDYKLLTEREDFRIKIDLLTAQELLDQEALEAKDVDQMPVAVELVVPAWARDRVIDQLHAIGGWEGLLSLGEVNLRR